MNEPTRPRSHGLPAGILAVLVHGAFFALLYFGVNWRNDTPQAMQVEIWDSLPAARVMPDKVEPASPAPPAPPLKVLPPVQQTQAVVQPDAEITTAKSKKLPPKPKQTKTDTRAERQKRALAEKQAQTEREKLALVERDRLAQAERDRLAQLEREQQAQAAQRTQVERARLAVVERERQTQTERDQQAQAEREHQAQTERARQQAEQAAVTGRVLDEYIGKIQIKVRRNIVLPPDVPDDAQAVFEVTLLPGGAVLNVTLAKPSGNLLYDSAVERAILKAGTLPVPADPALFSRFRELRLKFCPKEELCK